MTSKALSMAGVNLRRVFRDRTNLFFLFVLPFLLVLVLGAAFGEASTPKLGVVAGGPLLTALRAEPAFRAEEVADEAALRTAVERGEFGGGLVVTPSELRFLAREDRGGPQLRLALGGVLARESGLVAAARFASAQTGRDIDRSFVESVAANVPRISVVSARGGESVGRFDISASSQLLLFVFLTALTSSAALVETRRLGVSRRMLATPTSAATVVLGEGLGRVAVALLQGVVILAGTAVLFGVRWGDPLGAAALLLAFGLLAGGAGMLLGAMFRTEQQVGGFGLMLGLGLAALGGSMVPLELFGDTMRVIARLTPHAWAGQGYTELAHDGGLVDVLPELGVLLVYAAVLFALGAWRLRRTLTA